MKMAPRIKSVQNVVSESDKANRKDIQRLSKVLREQRGYHSMTLDDSVLIDLLRKKLMADCDLLAKVKEIWFEQRLNLKITERKLYGLNLKRLTHKRFGYFESAIQMLDNQPFAFLGSILGCQDDYPVSSLGEYFKNACMGRVLTTCKLLLIYSIFAVATHNEQVGGKSPQKLKEQLHLGILANSQFVYQMPVPPCLHSLMSECWLYCRSKNANMMLVPNCGYVFGGLVQPVAPYNRGLDCTSFTGWITGCGRPLTYLYEIAWNLNRGKPPGKDIAPKDKNVIKMFCDRHEAIEPRGSEMCPGDILVWRHFGKRNGGHAMFVQKVVDDHHILTVECTSYKDGHYEGYQERVVPILDPNPLGGRTMVLRPLNQDTYYNFRNRNFALIADLNAVTPPDFSISSKMLAPPVKDALQNMLSGITQASPSGIGSSKREWPSHTTFDRTREKSCVSKGQIVSLVAYSF